MAAIDLTFAMKYYVVRTSGCPPWCEAYNGASQLRGKCQSRAALLPFKQAKQLIKVPLQACGAGEVIGNRNCSIHGNRW